MKLGLCHDPDCHDPDDPCETSLCNGLWRCDGCVEAEQDNEDFIEANYLDISGN